ncbi:MAG: hypothetical protein LKCHEGNO_01546 [Burkholderiaceae bacterium]|nr:hypothetical protein [Burkholderiaceae bacterium]
MELALGTVQFGLRYGLADGPAPVAEREVRTILARAASLGIRMLDTAAVYGDIEARLAALAGDEPFRVITKLAPLPDGLRAADAAGWVRRSLDQAAGHLGGLLHGVMFHRADDLLGDAAQALWTAGAEWCATHGCKLGVSCYEPQTLARIRDCFQVALAQLPGNALDQRLRQASPAAGVEVHMRSVFLQGLLLMPLAESARRMPRAAPALQRWHAWLREAGLTPLVGALGIAKGVPGPSHCVVGVDNVGQFEEIVAAWREAPVLHAEALAESDLGVIDPRLWASK